MLHILRDWEGAQHDVPNWGARLRAAASFSLQRKACELTTSRHRSESWHFTLTAELPSCSHATHAWHGLLCAELLQQLENADERAAAAAAAAEAAEAEAAAARQELAALRVLPSPCPLLFDTRTERIALFLVKHCTAGRFA